MSFSKLKQSCQAQMRELVVEFGNYGFQIDADNGFTQIDALDIIAPSVRDIYLAAYRPDWSAVEGAEVPEWASTLDACVIKKGGAYWLPADAVISGALRDFWLDPYCYAPAKPGQIGRQTVLPGVPVLRLDPAAIDYAALASMALYFSCTRGMYSGRYRTAARRYMRKQFERSQEPFLYVPCTFGKWLIFCGSDEVLAQLVEDFLEPISSEERLRDYVVGDMLD